MIQRLM